MAHLYELTQDVLALQKLAEDAEDPSQFEDTIKLIEGEFEKKAAGVVLVVKNIETPIAAIDAEIERLQAMKKRINNSCTWFMEYLRSNMERTGINKIECSSPPFVITLCQGREIAQINDEASIPDEYVNVETIISVDKNKLVKALKSLEEGEEIPGASLTRAKSYIKIK